MSKKSDKLWEEFEQYANDSEKWDGVKDKLDELSKRTNDLLIVKYISKKGRNDDQLYKLVHYEENNVYKYIEQIAYTKGLISPNMLNYCICLDIENEYVMIYRLPPIKDWMKNDKGPQKGSWWLSLS